VKHRYADPPTAQEIKDAEQETIRPGDKILVRQADGRIVSIRGRNRHPLEEAFAALLAFACGALVSLILFTVIRLVKP
jgi:hypothetical protein